MGWIIGIGIYVITSIVFLVLFSKGMIRIVPRKGPPKKSDQ